MNSVILGTLFTSRGHEQDDKGLVNAGKDRSHKPIQIFADNKIRDILNNAPMYFDGDNQNLPLGLVGNRLSHLDELATKLDASDVIDMSSFRVSGDNRKFFEKELLRSLQEIHSDRYADLAPIDPKYNVGEDRIEGQGLRDDVLRAVQGIEGMKKGLITFYNKLVEGKDSPLNRFISGIKDLVPKFFPKEKTFTAVS